MERPNDKTMEALKGLRLGFSNLVRRYPSTQSVNKLLEGRTLFQFPVVTDNSQEDILAHYFALSDGNYPDEFSEFDIDVTELGLYIHYGFDGLFEEAVKYLILDDKGHEYTKRYAILYLTTVFEKRGPWALTYQYSVVKRVYTTLGVKDDTPFNLFERLGISTGLIYYKWEAVPNRAAMMERVTDEASRSPSKLHWLMGPIRSSDSDKHVFITCVCMTLAKSIRVSANVSDFKSRFDRQLRFCARHGLGVSQQEESPLPMIKALYEKILDAFGKNLRGHHNPFAVRPNNGFDPVDYVDYYSKAIIYALEVYGLSLEDVVQDIDPEVIRLLFK